MAGWLGELVRRRMFREVGLYIALGFAVTEGLGYISELLGLGVGFSRAVLIAWLFGIPVFTWLAWLFDVDADGIRRTHPTKPKGLLAIVIGITVVLSGTLITLLQVHFDDTPGYLADGDTPALAILPFEIVGSDDTALVAVGEALGDDLIAFLGRNSDVSVRAPYSTFSLAASGLDGMAIGGRLDTDLVVEGTLRITGEMVHVTAKLSDFSQQMVIWSDRYQVPYAEILSVQAVIAEQIAASLGRTLSGEALEDPARPVAREAYELLSRARSIWRHSWSDGEQQQAAIELLRSSLALDPDDPMANAILAEIMTVQLWGAEDRHNPLLELAESYAEHALTLDPDMPEALGALSMIRQLQQRWTEARELADRVVAINGGRLHSMTTQSTYRLLGHSQRALELILDAYEDDPLNSNLTAGIVGYALGSGETEIAARYYAIHRELVGGPSFADYKWAEELAMQGENDRASEVMFPVAMGFFRDPDLARAMTDLMVRVMGSVGSQDAELREALMSAPLPPPLKAAYLIELGFYEEGFAISTRVQAAGAFNPVGLYAVHLDAARQHPGFEALMREVGLWDYWLNVESPDFCTVEAEALQCG